MPIASSHIFDSNGNIYNTSKILDENSHLNETAYEIYGNIEYKIN